MPSIFKYSKDFVHWSGLFLYLSPVYLGSQAGNNRYKGPKDLPNPLKELEVGVQNTLKFY